MGKTLLGLGSIGLLALLPLLPWIQLSYADSAWVTATCKIVQTNTDTVTVQAWSNQGVYDVIIKLSKSGNVIYTEHHYADSSTSRTSVSIKETITTSAQPDHLTADVLNKSGRLVATTTVPCTT